MLQVDPYSLRFLASRFAAAADEVRRKASRMEEITVATTGGSSGWKGQAANQFVHRNEFIATELRDSVKQFDEIVSALTTLASRVEMIQSKEQRLHHLQQQRSQTKDGRKTVLKPNVEYTSPEGYTYKTDDKGRISSVEGKLSLGKGERNKYAQTKTGHSGDTGDEGGHLIASIFKGSGDIDNLVPMNGNLNKGEWKKLENFWSQELKSNHSVEVKIKPIYKGDATRPDSFKINYRIASEEWIPVFFKNSPGGK